MRGSSYKCAGAGEKGTERVRAYPTHTKQNKNKMTTPESIHAHSVPCDQEVLSVVYENTEDPDASKEMDLIKAYVRMGTKKYYYTRVNRMSIPTLFNLVKSLSLDMEDMMYEKDGRRCEKHVEMLRVLEWLQSPTEKLYLDFCNLHEVINEKIERIKAVQDDINLILYRVAYPDAVLSETEKPRLIKFSYGYTLIV